MVTAKKTGAATKSAAGKTAPVARSEAKTEARPSAASGLPFVDMSEMLRQFKLPGVDLAELMRGRRKDIEAVTDANRLAYEGLTALGRRQAEMMSEAMAEWRDAAQALTSTRSAESVGKRSDLAGQVFGKMLSNMRELAEMAAASQAQAGEIVTRRFQENLAELRKAIKLE